MKNGITPWTQIKVACQTTMNLLPSLSQVTFEVLPRPPFFDLIVQNVVKTVAAHF